MLDEKTVKKYLHVNPRLQELEDDLNEEAQRHIKENEKDVSYLPVSLHDEEVLAIKLKGDKFVMRVTHGIPEWIASDLTKTCCDFEKYGLLVFDIIITGVSVESISNEFFNKVTIGAEIYKEILKKHDEIIYIIRNDFLDDDDNVVEIEMKFDTYRYKMLGEITYEQYSEICNDCNKKKHPLCVID